MECNPGLEPDLVSHSKRDELIWLQNVDIKNLIWYAAIYS